MHIGVVDHDNHTPPPAPLLATHSSNASALPRHVGIALEGRGYLRCAGLCDEVHAGISRRYSKELAKEASFCLAFLNINFRDEEGIPLLISDLVIWFSTLQQAAAC
jgi:hypothetical protein